MSTHTAPRPIVKTDGIRIAASAVDDIQHIPATVRANGTGKPAVHLSSCFAIMAKDDVEARKIATEINAAVEAIAAPYLQRYYNAIHAATPSPTKEK